MQVSDVLSVWALQAVEEEGGELRSDTRVDGMSLAFTSFPQSLPPPCGLAG